MNDAVHNQSGGADLNAQGDINVGNDIVGRDKLESHNTIVTNTAAVIGSGVVVQGDGAVVAGAGGVAVGGSVYGGVNITSITDAQQYDVYGLASPYLGLQNFTYADNPKYAGREKLVSETVKRITDPASPLSLLFVTGASGSGKSSFVQAGVLPALEQHYAALSVKWAVFRPSRDPLAALADAVWRQLGMPAFDTLWQHRNLPAHDPENVSADKFGDFLQMHFSTQQVNVIVVDQFEEIFTQTAAHPRESFCNLLTHLPLFRATHTHFIVTVRADYLPELFGLPTLYDIAKDGIALRAMSVAELREAIQQPLRATYPNSYKRFQSDLVERLAADASVDAAYLPLLQVTLDEKWRKGSLTIGPYINLADAIQQRAEAVLTYQDYDAAQPSQLRSPDEQAAILNLCLDLVDVSLDDEARRDVRRRRSKDELVSSAPERVQLINALTKARLLSVDTEFDGQIVEVDLIHETLLFNWERLQQAIAERRDELRQRVRFEQQLKEWIAHDRTGDYLLTGVRLAEAHELERRNDISMRGLDAKDFLQCSIEREESRRQKELNDARRRAVVFTVIAVIALVTAGIAFFFGNQSNQNAITAEHEANNRATAEANALNQRDEARRQASIALSRQLAAQSASHLSDAFDLALLLAIESGRAADTAEARNSLLTAVERHSSVIALMRSYSGAVGSVAFSPDGKLLATGNGDGSIVLWDVATHRLLAGPLGAQMGYVGSVAFSPDGKMLASASGVDPFVTLLDSATYQRLDSFLPGDSGVYSVVFSPDGKTFATSGPNSGFTLFDVATREPLVEWQPVGITETVNSVSFSPDGKILALGSSDAKIYMWDVATRQPLGEPLTNESDRVDSVVFSPAGSMLAAGGCSKLVDYSCTAGDIRLWDVATRQGLGEPLTGMTGTVSSMAFSPDGKMLASSGSDAKIYLWDMAAHQRLGEPLTGHTDAVTSVAFSPDGQMLVSGSADDTIIMWNISTSLNSNLATRQGLGKPLTGVTDAVNSVAFSPDGKTLAMRGAESIVLWDVAARQRLGELTTQTTSMAFSPDGKTLASRGAESIVLWDVAARQRLGELTTQATSMAFSPDGKTLASGFTNGTFKLWDMASHQSLGDLGYEGVVEPVVSMAFSPDGRILATYSQMINNNGQAFGSIFMWDVATHKELEAPIPTTTAYVGVLAFSPDGRTLAYTSDPRTISLWNVATSQAQGAPITDYTGIVDDVAFSTNGQMLAFISNGSITLWDVETHQRLGEALGTDVKSMAFSPDGKAIVSSGSDGAIFWDIDHDSWTAQACEMAGRNLTRLEWANYFGEAGITYRKTCEQWPLEPEVTPTPAP